MRGQESKPPRDLNTESMGNLHSSPWEGKLLLEGPYTFQNNYQVPWAFPAIICLCAMTILPL